MLRVRRDPDCMGGRDFRGQNDAKKAQKARLPEADREGLHSALCGRKQARHEKQRMEQHRSRRCAKSEARLKLHGRT